MQVIHVSAGNGYDVCIGCGLLQQAGAQLAGAARGRRVLVVSDSSVAPLYLPGVRTSLEGEGFEVHDFVFPAGEEQKNTENYLALLRRLAQLKLTRDDTVVTLGGGVVSDLGGFAAATYLRGIRLVHMPTTLLAMVDAAVGGKTAVNLPEGKNLCGAFYQPVRVLCDPDVLQTLPDPVFRDGFAEVIKYGMLGDRELLCMLRQPDIHGQMGDIIARCVAMKREMVEQDEKDHGMRQMLNLGHTFGHAVEAASGYQVSHGQAVAIGMAMVTRAAVWKGMCAPEVLQALMALLEQYRLPHRTEIQWDVLAEKMLADKKRSGDQLVLIVPGAWGACERIRMPAEEALNWLKEGCGA